MANRYWVGGTADWDATAGTKWALTSGGAGGEAVPTVSDDVFFDANSGAGTITVASNSVAKSVLCTGFTGTLAGSFQLDVRGSVTFVSGMTLTYSGSLRAINTSSGGTFDTGGKTILGPLSLGTSNAGTVNLLSDINSTSTVTISVPTFNTNNYNITCTSYTSNTSNLTNAHSYGSSIFVVTSFTMDSDIILDAGTSVITITGGTFTGAGKIYYDLNTVNSVTITGANTFNTLDATGTGTLAISGNVTVTGATTISGVAVSISGACIFANITITGVNATFSQNCTFAAFTITGGSSKTLTISSGKTLTVTSFSATGTSTSDRLNITGGIISDTTGTNTATHCVISSNTVSGGATFKAASCTNAGGANSGWIWDDLINPSNAFANDGSFATCATAANGTISIKLSGDGGATFTSTLTKTVGSVEEEVTFGTGATELWGMTWNGSVMSDTNFRLMIGCGAFTPETSYKTFGFVIPTVPLTGIEIVVSAFYTSGTTTLSIDHIKVRVYYGVSTLPVSIGSQVFVSDGRKPGESAGSGTGTIAYFDGIDWRAVETGSTISN